VTSFDEMNLSVELLRGIYGYGFASPSIVQQTAIVPLSSGRDVIAQSQSGTGKTGAFSIGVLQRIDCALPRVQALILAPTRELAVQSFKVISAIGQPMGASVHVSIGGSSVQKDISTLGKAVHVQVGTPGRIMDLIRRRILRTDDLKILILDEADEMLAAGGFLEAVQEILREIPSACQIGLFSATLPPETLEVTEHFMKNPVRLVLNKEVLTLEGIAQYYIDVQRDEWKLDTLVDLFDSVSVAQCIIFCNSRRKADWLSQKMTEKDFSISCIHSDMPPAERTDTMEAFIRGNSRVLIATDLIARGIDVQGVGFVVNFDMTRDFSNYIHRIGRGGRFGRKGVAINFVTSEEGHLLRELCAYYNTAIVELPADFTLLPS